MGASAKAQPGGSDTIHGEIWAAARVRLGAMRDRRAATPFVRLLDHLERGWEVLSPLREVGAGSSPGAWVREEDALRYFVYVELLDQFRWLAHTCAEAVPAVGEPRTEPPLDEMRAGAHDLARAARIAGMAVGQRRFSSAVRVPVRSAVAGIIAWTEKFLPLLDELAVSVGNAREAGDEQHGTDAGSPRRPTIYTDLWCRAQAELGSLPDAQQRAARGALHHVERGWALLADVATKADELVRVLPCDGTDPESVLANFLDGDVVDLFRGLSATCRAAVVPGWRGAAFPDDLAGDLSLFRRYLCMAHLAAAHPDAPESIRSVFLPQIPALLEWCDHAESLFVAVVAEFPE